MNKSKSKFHKKRNITILITGSKGFIGKNLVYELRNQGYENIIEYDIDTSDSLEKLCMGVDFVFHLAGVNRTKSPEDYINVNYRLTKDILRNLERYNQCPVMISSSIQAELDNPYGISKKMAENLLIEYHNRTAARILIYRLPNVFGKWCRPNYNSVVATFCNNIANDLPIRVNNPNSLISLAYIDDVIDELLNALNGKESREGNLCKISNVYRITLGNVVNLIYSFKKSRENLILPDVSDTFVKYLYSTYLSYLPENRFSYNLKMNIDHRGSFTEFLKSNGQVCVNISKPGIIKGNHWHHTKIEKFLVVSGRGIIRLRKIDSDKIIEYAVSGNALKVVDIPPGYTHNIENTGETDMITIMWVNEPLDPDNPDTYHQEV